MPGRRRGFKEFAIDKRLDLGADRDRPGGSWTGRGPYGGAPRQQAVKCKHGIGDTAVPRASAAKSTTERRGECEMMDPGRSMFDVRLWGGRSSPLYVGPAPRCQLLELPQVPTVPTCVVSSSRQLSAWVAFAATFVCPNTFVAAPHVLKGIASTAAAA
ncbi:hypothetical protein BCR44DRAFT_1431261, partial [Catenaria anguillulae PL171]